MRVLVVSVPASGHVNPLVPLARRLRADGDEVVWATGPELCQQLEPAGFVTASVGPPMAVWFERLAARTRGRPGDGIAPERSTHWFAPRLFGEVGAALMVDDLVALARDLSPDVVLYESRCYAAPAVAHVVGALPVLQAVTTLLPPEVEVLVGDAVTPLWRQLGLGSPTYAGVFDGLTFSAWPASLDDPSPYGRLVVHRLAPSPLEAPAPAWLASWVLEQQGRPIIYATLGTVFGGNAPVLRAVVDALAGEDVSVLMTVGPSGDPEALGSLPAHARVERYVAQEALLPHCAAVVSHAGAGTTLGALAHGLPQVCLPQGADQFINAARCEAAGLGRRLMPADVSAETVRRAVREALDDPRYASSAQAMRTEMAAAMTSDEAVALIRRHLPRRSSPNAADEQTGALAGHPVTRVQGQPDGESYFTGWGRLTWRGWALASVGGPCCFRAVLRVPGNPVRQTATAL